MGLDGRRLTAHETMQTAFTGGERAPLQTACPVNEGSSMDFVIDSPSSGRRLK
jgi:hypothetical protein